MKNNELSTLGVALGGLYVLLNSFIQSYIWDKPEMIWFMFSLYHLGLILELICDWKAGKFSILTTRKKTLRVLENSLGALILLFMASGIARFSTVLFWMPQGVLAILFGTLAVAITKNASRLKWITPQIADFIESKVKTSIEKNKNDEQDPPTPDAFPDEEVAEHETNG
jgi:hypothetical protein